MSYGKSGAYRGFFDPPSFFDIMSCVTPFLAPFLWARREKIKSFLSSHYWWLGGAVTTVFTFAVMLYTGNSISQIFARYELYPSIAYLPVTITSHYAWRRYYKSKK